MYIIQMPNVVVGTGVRLNVHKGAQQRCPNILSLCTNKEDKNVTLDFIKYGYVK